MTSLSSVSGIVGEEGELVSGRGERGSGECTLPPGFPCTAKMCVGGPFIRCLGRRWGGAASLTCVNNVWRVWGAARHMSDIRLTSVDSYKAYPQLRLTFDERGLPSNTCDIQSSPHLCPQNKNNFLHLNIKQN